MKQRKRIEWARLDNASKIFPATYNQRDTKVFRLVCELKEAIDPDTLQTALDKTIREFPLFRSVLRKGVFWYYFETSDIMPVIEEEALPVCAPLYIKDRKNLLFRVSYFGNRINLEVFHALSDGTGSLWFLKSLVCHYLFLVHQTELQLEEPSLGYNASISKKMDDSFGRYFAGNKAIRHGIREIKAPRAYRIRGSKMDENRTKVIEGCLSTKAVLEQAHAYHTSLTVFISSLLLYAIYKEMPVRSMNLPITLSIPINLRQFYESETARNFFSTMPIGYAFSDKHADFAEIIKSVDESFKKELAAEKLKNHLNRLMAFESNPFTRIIPLPLKDLSLRIVNRISDRGITAGLSNIGRISMPQELCQYIEKFSVFTSARRPQICICSFEDRLVITFSTPFQETEIQRTFFGLLAEKGIKIEIAANQ